MARYASTLDGRKIGFIGKGGAGKSTWLVITALALRDRGCDVCVLDSDSTNEGLPAALGIAQPPRPLIDYFGGMVFQGGKVTCPVDDPTPLAPAGIDLASLPAEFVAQSPTGVSLLTAGKLADFGVGAGCDGPIIKIARDLIVRHKGHEVTTLVDLKAGIEDTARGVMVGFDHLVAVCDPTVAGLGVARCVTQVLDRMRHDARPSTAHLDSPAAVELANALFRKSRLRSVTVVLNRVPDAATEEYMRGRLAEWGIEAVAVLPDSSSVRDAWLRGGPLPAEPALDAQADRVLQALALESPRAK